MNPSMEGNLTEKAVAALKAAVARVVEDHRRRGAPLAVWRDGKAVWEVPGPPGYVRDERSVYPGNGDRNAADLGTDVNKEEPR